jgi:hypothetical protein
LLIADAVKAARAIDWISISGNERNGRQLTTFGAHNLGLGAILNPHFRLSGRATRRATNGKIRQTLFMEELLLASGPGKGGAAIATREHLVKVLHHGSSHERA